MRPTVVIADDEPITRIDLLEILTNNNYQVVGSVPTGIDAIESCKKHNPDLVLMDVKMPLLDGIKAATVINKENLAGCVILLTAYSNPDFVSQAIDAGVTGYIVKPFDEHSLLPAVEVSLAKQREIATCYEEIDKLSQKIQDRIIIEKAKGILCHYHQWTEDESYKYMRTIAMEKGYTIATIADAIILNSES